MKFLLFVVLASASVFANANQMYCNTGNGGYLLEYNLAAGLQKLKVTVINASGVEDASGDLSCTGPNEAAFVCSGDIPTLADNGTFSGPKRFFELTIGEAAVQVGQGQIMLGRDFVSCTSKF